MADGLQCCRRPVVGLVKRHLGPVGEVVTTFWWKCLNCGDWKNQACGEEILDLYASQIEDALRDAKGG
jgi:hypothetical protein